MQESDDEEDAASFYQLHWIDRVAPCFEVDPDKIEILREPREYYAYLIKMCAEAKHRIVISSLYLGTGEMEQRLVDTIETNLATNDALRVRVLLDYSRGHRGDPSSMSMLRPLVQRYGEERVQVELYHTPALRGLVRYLLSERTNETIGVMHMKIYIADDTLLVSGANLSNDYFVNRQDRYVVLRDSQALCDFFEALRDAIAASSFSVCANTGDAVFRKADAAQHPFLGDRYEFARGLYFRVNAVLQKYHGKHRANINNLNSEEISGALIYPLLQIRDCGLLMDELATLKLLRCAPTQSFTYLAVGYFNLTSGYIEGLLSAASERAAHFDILVSAPQANGFYGAQGFSSHIPNIYSHLEEQFVNAIQNSGNDENVRLFEYERKHWTFHGKGLWHYPQIIPNTDNLPSFTLVGSSNFGYRSVYRDLEAQLLIHANGNKPLQRRLHEEKCALFEEEGSITRVTPSLFHVASRRVPAWLKVFTRVFRSYF